MKIAVATKLVPDDQDIVVDADRTLNFSKAKGVISAYDVNAIEVGARLAEAADGVSLVALSVGPSSVDDSKLKKNVLARGVNELFLVADDALDGLDAYETAEALASLVGEASADDKVELVLCGDGSADNYAQQVDVQLASRLGWPIVNAVSAIEIDDGKATLTRVLEDDEEVVEVALPAVVSVTPDAAIPRIPGMKEILAAGKKPVHNPSVPDVTPSNLETLSCLAPAQTERKLVIYENADDAAIADVAAAIKRLL